MIEGPDVVEGPVYHDPPAVVYYGGPYYRPSTAHTGAGGATGGDGYFVWLPLPNASVSTMSVAKYAAMAAGIAR